MKVKKFVPRKLSPRQIERFKKLCDACGFKPDFNNWLEMCTTNLYEKICGYSNETMNGMMYPFMLKTVHPIDRLYKKFKEEGLTFE